jgi:hypothetical protein
MILALAQFCMFILAYCYHSSAGLFNLCWLISSFVLPTDQILFMSIVFMVPLLTWEFVFIYVGRVPMIKETWFFENYGKYFKLDMWNPLVEQLFMFMTLLTFYMMISSYLRRQDTPNVENGLIRFFRRRIYAK